MWNISGNSWRSCRPRYEAVADICVDTDGKDVDAISEEILKAVEDRS